MGAKTATARRRLRGEHCTARLCRAEYGSHSVIARLKRGRVTAIELIRTQAPVDDAALARSAAAAVSLPAGTTAGPASVVPVPGGAIVRVEQTAGSLPVFAAAAAVSVSGDGQVALVAQRLASGPPPEPTASPLPAAALLETAALEAATDLGTPRDQLTVADKGAWVYDPSLFGEPGVPDRVTRIDATAPDGRGETLLLDSGTGAVRLREQHHSDAARVVCDAADGAGGVCPGGGKPERTGDRRMNVAEVDAAFDAIGLYDRYLGEVLNRDSLDGRGMALKATVRIKPDDGNASWDPDTNQFYARSGWMVADIVWHELTHGLAQFLVGGSCSGLCTNNLESGAIGESVADVFAMLIKHTPPYGAATASWLVGDGATAKPDGVRDFADPASRGQPATMADFVVLNAGEHTNAGIPNRTAFLIIAGPDAIGPHKAAQIYFRAMASLTPTASFRELASQLSSSCAALIGTSGITAGDCERVQAATYATGLSPVGVADDVARAVGQNPLPYRIARVPSTGAAYLIDTVGKPHWIPDAATYNCVAGRGIPFVTATQREIDAKGDGKPHQPKCDQIVRVAATATSYYLDRAGGVHWIPDAETYECVTSRGVGVAEVTQAQVDTLGNGKPWQPGCRSVIARVAATGTSYLVDASGKPHWIPDGSTFSCLTRRFAVVEIGQAFIDRQGDGKPWQPRCQSVVRVSATGTAYVYDSSGQLRWIPDGETYHCMLGRYGLPLADGLFQSHVDTLGDGQPWQDRCLDPQRVRGKVLRVAATGTSYFVDLAGNPHWIRDSGLYTCLTRRGIAVVDGLQQAHVDSIGNGQPWQPPCNSIATVTSTGTSYLLDNDGTPRWIPDAETYHCLTGRGYRVEGGIPQSLIDALGNGQPWTSRCMNPNRARGHILTVAGGPSYIHDGTLRWIPGAETYWCWRNRGYAPIEGLTQEHVDSLGNGQPWAPECMDPARARRHVVREKGGTAYFVDGGDWWHWIPTGAIYNCLVARYPLINNVTWGEINSLRRENGVNANCSM